MRRRSRPLRVGVLRAVGGRFRDGLGRQAGSWSCAVRFPGMPWMSRADRRSHGSDDRPAPHLGRHGRARSPSCHAARRLRRGGNRVAGCRRRAWLRQRCHALVQGAQPHAARRSRVVPHRQAVHDPGAEASAQPGRHLLGGRRVSSDSGPVDTRGPAPSHGDPGSEDRCVRGLPLLSRVRGVGCRRSGAGSHEAGSTRSIGCRPAATSTLPLVSPPGEPDAVLRASR